MGTEYPFGGVQESPLLCGRPDAAWPFRQYPTSCVLSRLSQQHAHSEAANQIAAVVQENTAMAEESSASSEELAAQSEKLKELIGAFQLLEM